jgi:hypothetical protein
MTRAALLFFVPLFASACGGGNDNLPPPPPPPPPAPASLAPAPAPKPLEDAGAVAEKPTAPPPTLLPGTASPDPTPAPSAKILTPKKDEVIPGDKASDYAVKLDVKNWQTAKGGTHVHLILDNKPYMPIYDAKAPVRLSDLAAGGTLEEGQHVLVAFPSRANHESVKTKDAVSIIEFYVGKKGDRKTDTKKPMLISSRPKGDYKGDWGNHVLVDFQLANDTLAEGKDHVNVNVTGPGIEKELTAKVEKFGTPYYLDNLQDGTYTVKLELADKDNHTLPGPWNTSSRTITVDHAATPEVPVPTTAAGSAPTDSGRTAPAPDAGKPAKK